MNALIGGLAALLYLLAGSWLAARLARASRGGPGAKGGPLALGWSAAILHAMILSQTVFSSAGLNLGFFNALSFTGWLIGVLLLAAAMVRPVENLGIIVLPFCALTLIFGLLFPSARIVADTGQWPLELHILIAILAYSLLTLAAVQALLLAVQDYRLRHRQPGGFLRGIPPLTAMESLLFQMIGAGFVLLSITLASGLFFLEDIFAQHLVHKTVLSFVAWGVFGVLLWGRWRFGWRGRTAIRWTLSGFTFLLLAYFGSKLVLELVLRRY
ncbi:MAG TPA: cytochrome c biogenesis protein CcsA [Candidatus Competibacteraceae bacterium]|nr:cytochrome c biogenesis protein CcsA [Candidatus Competibacteraceae bacterium]HRZ04818.1 cytochrome c biogenesis protein CcsA [Candidatus Competibacteraceae bacterium]HSA45584.1 cytochrome c biogenesis protein CcsA [Candidatus Competibacteraceae bacterium]